MSFCPSCGVEVREGKAFCYNCGEPMTQSGSGRGDKPAPDLFKATVVGPPPPFARPSQPAAAPPKLRQPASEMTRGAGRGARRKFFYGKFGLGVAALLLLVLLGLFVLAVVLD